MSKRNERDAQTRRQSSETGREHPKPQTTDEPANHDQDSATPQHTCYDCVYAQWDKGLWLRQLAGCWPSLPMCTIHPDAPGTLRQVPPGGPCQHFRPKWKPPLRLDPPEPPNDEIRYIALTKGKLATVDAADYEWLSQYKWCVTSTPEGRPYAYRKDKGKTVYMHREIMQPPPGMVVDHISGDSLNNRRQNLRNCTPQENMRNRDKFRGDSSRFKGVSPCVNSDKWRAAIGVDGCNIHIGVYETEIEAAHAYDQKAKELFGEFARLNFPDEVGT